MAKVPFTLTAAVMLAVFLCLGNAKILAQCTICVSAVDQTCSGSHADCETSTGGCSSSSVFQVSCNGSYDLGAKIYSCTNACDCNSCVMVLKEASGSVQGSIRSFCENQLCSQTTTVYLETGIDYRLYVCKRPCSSDPGIDCEDCDEDCKALGWVSGAVTSCP
ncbi:hypothetical protein HUU59_05415 [bacterium]|nr:hypothetical protein [bacterium]